MARGFTSRIFIKINLTSDLNKHITLSYFANKDFSKTQLLFKVLIVLYNTR